LVAASKAVKLPRLMHYQLPDESLSLTVCMFSVCSSWEMNLSHLTVTWSSLKYWVCIAKPNIYYNYNREMLTLPTGRIPGIVATRQ